MISFNLLGEVADCEVAVGFLLRFDLKPKQSLAGKDSVSRFNSFFETLCMFRRPFLLILLLSPALLGAGSWYYLTRPFEPLSALPREVCGWLLKNDAAEASLSMQTDLYERCRIELLDATSALDWSELDEALKTVDHEQRARWDRNVRWWCRQWWFNEARAYASVASEQRTKYLQDKLAHWTTHEWVALGKLRSAGEANAAQGMTSAMLTEWSAEIESWISATEPIEQPRLQEFWAALRWQFLMKPALWKNLSS